MNQFHCCTDVSSFDLPQITQAGQDGSQCGIGVVFRMDMHGALVVDSLVPGGPAWESATQGGLQVGDVLQTVDGKNVYRFHYCMLCSFAFSFSPAIPALLNHLTTLRAGGRWRS